MVLELPFAVSTLVALLALRDGEDRSSPVRPLKGAAAGGGGRAAERSAQSGGVTIEFTEAKLAESDRTPQGELKAVLAAKAVLKAERPIRYRSVVLPAGAYSVSVIADEERAVGRNLYFLIGPAEKAGQDVDGPAPEEKKESTPREKGKPGRAAKKPAPSEAPGDPVPGDAGLGDGKPTGDKSDKSVKKAAPGQIKAIFHLGPAPKAAETVEFAVRPTARGDRFALTIRAGSSQGKATVRFAD